MSRKHTPGPWKLIDGFVAGYKEDHLGNPVADCVCYVSGASDHHDANLSLIMSAPELLEALEEVLEDGLKTNRKAWVLKATSAIKKARGEE